MFKGLQHKISSLLPTQVGGLEINFNSEGDREYHLCLISKKGSEITVDDEFSASDIQSILERLPKGVPLAIQITGRGVLNKILKTSEVEELEDDELANKIMPGASANTFFVQRTVFQETGFASLMRQDSLQELTNELKDVFKVSVGLGFHAATLFELIHPGTTKVGKFVFEKSGQAFEKVTVSDQGNDFDAGGKQLPAKFALSYVVAFQYLIGMSQFSLAESQFVDEASEYRQSVIFKRAGVAAAVGFFALLLVNYFLFSSYQSENLVLKSRVSQISLQLDLRDSLSTEVNYKMEFFEQAGWLDQTKHSLYCDEIAHSVPKQLSLTLLEVNPYDIRKSTEEKKPVFRQRLISIQGNAKTSNELNPWIDKIRQMPFVESASIEDYDFDAFKKMASFKISVSVK